MKIYFSQILLFLSLTAFANEKDSTQNKVALWGDFKSTNIVYNPDINPFVYYPKIASQNYLDLNFAYQRFQAGFRLESYWPALVGMPNELKGWGLANKFVRYQSKNFSLGLGNHYEQFGNGLIFKTQEQRALGMDNSLDGIWGNFRLKNVKIKIISGKQRIGFRHAAGWLTGIDFENKIKISKTTLSIGLSQIWKNEAYLGTNEAIKQNVFASSARAEVQKGNFKSQIESAIKSSDAAIINRYSTEIGSAIIWNTEWIKGNTSYLAQIKRTKNMDFRSERGQTQNTAIVNYIPNFTKIHTYRLLTLYPSASQVLGEIGGQIEVSKYLNSGSSITINLAAYDQPKNLSLENSYDKKLYREAVVEFEKELSENSKLNLLANYAHFNKGIVLGGFNEIIKFQTVVADWSFKINKNLSINTQAQHLHTQQDKGSWAMALLDLRIKSKVSVYFSDEYNYSRSHNYYHMGSNLNLGSKSIGLSYGKVREGLFCVGGICQIIPEYQGLNLSVTTRF
ncbi:hypothetical protein EGI22_09890 [Lacihabitans sp. LS3-19]|uniref:DUF6029 family protein n=1 Tax=Lacihabitans sp. LS3-19 TaxID=2487335 RepID=UPI0020CEF15D|nr:DUF6029 family protein [Lacihabitans sp. LS3-19]MCP9768222.1 hypothetical protein [Lacihabitans sp. LS3-19]